MDEPWFGVRCVFRHDDIPTRGPGRIYEERVILVRAGSFEQALAKAEAEAQEYTSGSESTCLDCANAFHLADERIDDGTEVYSLMRTSELDDDAFLTRYFDDGTEHTQTLPDPEERP